MKKIITLALAAAMVASLAACGSGSSTGSSSAASAGSAASQSAKSSTAKYAISIGYSTSEETAQGQAAIAIKKYMEANSKGQVSVTNYPNSQVKAARKCCRQYRTRAA